jgi:hypothetical protein
MSRSKHWATLGLAVAALVGLGGLATAKPAGETVARAKKLIENHAKKICAYTHAPKTYTFKELKYLGTTNTKDGRFEVTYQFKVKGNIKNQTMDIQFFFKDSGEFDFVRVKSSTTLYEPFTKLSAGYLKSVREETAKMPGIAGNTDLLKRVDASNGRQLCEIFLRETQLAEMKK